MARRGVTTVFAVLAIAAGLLAPAGADPTPAPVAAARTSFSDVPAGAWFELPVAWLTAEGITSGVGDGRYGANDHVTRAQMAAFLHRAAGSPAVSGSHGFDDVPDGAWFDDPVTWLVSEGITSGVGPGRYGPNDRVTRAQMAAFLHRWAGSPRTDTSHSFSDVPDGSWFDTPVAWLVDAGITSGVGGDRYGSNDHVTRAQMAAFLHRAAGRPDNENHWEFTGFTYFMNDAHEGPANGAGYSMYVAVWPIQETYPGSTFQTGLPSTWMTPVNLRNAGSDDYNTIEGGVGWWRDTRFATETPKFIVGAVSRNFFEWANGPGSGAGSAGVDIRDWNTPQGKYGVAQLANNVLWAPDGLNLAQGTSGDLFGYGYHPLPIIETQTTTNGQNITTGDRSWTLFVNTANFSGPLVFVVPNFWTKPVLANPSTEGLFLDSSASHHWRAVGLETQTIPTAHAQVGGVRYARVAPTLYPATDATSSVLVHRVSSYTDAALRSGTASWFAGGPAPSGAFGSGATHVVDFVGIDPDLEIGSAAHQGERFDVDHTVLGNPDVSDPTTFRFRWNLDVIRRDGDHFVMPEYYRLDTSGAEPIWRPVTAAQVPTSTGLHDHEFPHAAVRQDAYTTPTTGVWASPGPAAGPFTADLGDGSTVTYHWYRFIDQPAIRHWGFSNAQLAEMQSRVEAMHAAWDSDDTFLADPTTGSLASLDPAVLVEPPAGLGVGYVPIVTRQERTATP